MSAAAPALAPALLLSRVRAGKHEEGTVWPPPVVTVSFPFPGRALPSACCQPPPACTPSTCRSRRSRLFRPAPMRRIFGSPALDTSTWPRPASWSRLPPARPCRACPCATPRRSCSDSCSCAGPRPRRGWTSALPAGTASGLRAPGPALPAAETPWRPTQEARFRGSLMIISDLTGRLPTRYCRSSARLPSRMNWTPGGRSSGALAALAASRALRGGRRGVAIRASATLSPVLNGEEGVLPVGVFASSGARPESRVRSGRQGPGSRIPSSRGEYDPETDAQQQMARDQQGHRGQDVCCVGEPVWPGRTAEEIEEAAPARGAGQPGVPR